MLHTCRVVVTFGVLASLGACQDTGDHRTTDAAAVLAADSAWAQTFARKDMRAYLTFVDSNASILAPGAPAVSGLRDVRTLVESYMTLPGLRGTWHPERAEVARSGELAYTIGTTDLSYDDPSGQRINERGKYLEVWRKGADGRWRMVTEIFNADAPSP